MSSITILVALIFGFAGQVHAASVAYSYSAKGDTNGILAITGINEESSWRCRGESSFQCACPTILLDGKISKIDCRRGSAIAEGFVLDTSIGVQYINLGEDWDSDLGMANLSWIPGLIRKDESVLVVAEICGVGGRNIVARDIFSRRMLRDAMRRQTKQ